MHRMHIIRRYIKHPKSNVAVKKIISKYNSMQSSFFEAVRKVRYDGRTNA